MEDTSGVDQRRRVVQRGPHVAGMMQDAPRIDDVERSEGPDEPIIENRPLPNRPARIVREMPRAQLERAGHRLRIVIERHDGRAHPPRAQGEQAAAGAYVQERPAGQIAGAQRRLQTGFRDGDSLARQYAEKPPPVPAERETSGSKVPAVLRRRRASPRLGGLIRRQHRPFTTPSGQVAGMLPDPGFARQAPPARRIWENVSIPARARYSSFAAARSATRRAYCSSVREVSESGCERR